MTLPRGRPKGPQELPDHQRCTATAKSTGERCKLGREDGTDVCKYHGAKSLKGIAHPNYKTGTRSKSVPARMIERYEASRNDPDIIDMQDDLAILDARIDDLLKRVDTGEAGLLWKQARAAFKDFQKATKNNDPQAIAIALTQLDNILGRGHSDYLAWGEVKDTIEAKGRTADRQRRLLMDKAAVISVEEAMNMVSALLVAIRNNVTDPQTLNNISTEFSRIVDFPDRVGA